MKLLDEFVRFNPKCPVDNAISSSKLVIEQFESLRSDIGHSMQTDPYDHEEKNFFNYLLVRLRFILSRFGRIISIYEAFL